MRRLLHYARLVDAGCPVGRHELLDREWIALGIIKAERIKAWEQEQEEKRKKKAASEGQQP